MPVVCQKRKSKAFFLYQLKAWRKILFLLLQQRNRSVQINNETLMTAITQYDKHKREYLMHSERTRHIAMLRFEEVFGSLTDQDCLSMFRFTKSEIQSLAPRLCCDLYVIDRNQYSTAPLLSLAILLHRLATPFPWRDVETFFGKHSSQISETFWETAEHLYKEYGSLVTSDLSQPYFAQNAIRYAAAIHEKTSALDTCIAFIDGTNLYIAGPCDSGQQNVVYNGHKRQHTLKYQGITTPDGLFLHIYGPLEGRKHDWTLYSRSVIDAMLEEMLLINITQFCIYGDLGYNQRSYLCIPFQGSSLSEEQAAFNKAMAKGRVTVEWMFKEIKQHWTSTDFKRKLKLKEAPYEVLYLIAACLTNFCVVFMGTVYPHTLNALRRRSKIFFHGEVTTRQTTSSTERIAKVFRGLHRLHRLDITGKEDRR